MSAPSADELRTRVAAVLETANLDELTVKKLVGQLSTEFGSDLSARKSEVKQLVDELLPKAVEQRRKLETTNGHKHNDDDDDDDDDNNDNDDTHATKSAPKKKKSSGGKFPSLELRAVIGEDEKTVSYFTVIKLLWAYIKAHNLQSGRNILCDDKLRAVFGRDEVGSFQMAKFIGQHLLAAPDQSVGTVVQPDLTPKPKADKPAKKATKRKSAADTSDKTPRVVPEESKRFVSSQVAAIIGKDRATFFELTKLFWVYIKANGLQKPDAKTTIVCDDKLKAVFGVDTVGSFTMAKYFKQHLLEKDATGPREVTVVQPPPSAPKAKKEKSASGKGQAKKKAKVSKSSRADADSDEDDDGNVDDVVESEGEAADDDDDDDDEADDEDDE